MDIDADVVVVGGGPGGSAVSTLIAARGHRVLLLEKEHFPRYQIGESLLPATVHGIGRLLGVSRRLAEMSLSVRWDQSMAIEAALLSAAVIVVLLSAGRLAPERASD